MNYGKIEDLVMDILENGLDKNLFYHGVHHTKEVVKNSIFIAKQEEIDQSDIELLKIAALLHDVGFVETYTGHEEESCKIAKKILPGFDINSTQIEQICGMIMATKIPQNPKNLLEKIIADADLMYLGTDKFVEVGNTLFEELKANKKISSELEWNKIQVSFLNAHSYHTNYCIKNFTLAKNKNLELINYWLLKN